MACVDDVRNLLDYIRHAGAVSCQDFLQFPKGVTALRREIAGIHNFPGLLMLRTDTSEKNHFCRPGNRHRFGEAAFGPMTVIKVPLLEISLCPNLCGFAFASTGCH
jgi:hypothetical protein